MTSSEQDLFFYVADEVSHESLLNYKPGGLHPIILGDILPEAGTCVSDKAKSPRYRIAQKLGFGGWSTVWLARDLVEQRFVAVKIPHGTQEIVESNEAKILRQIHQNGRGKSGYENIVELYDLFTIRGPNGFHECLVTEVVIPTSFFHNYSAPQLVKQLLRGFNFLHEAGIVHGDPHSENFGFAVPQLQQFEEKTIADDCGCDSEILPVVPRDLSFPKNTVPRYLVGQISIRSFLQEKECLPSQEEVCLKILDFGRASWMNEPVKELPGATPPMVRPPEVYMHMLSGGTIGSVWSKEADIWAIGCAASTMGGGGDIGTTQGNLHYQLYHGLQYGGAPPEEWSRFWNSEKFYEEMKGWEWPESPVFDTEEAWWTFTNRLSDPNRELFIDLIRKMVTTVPAKRNQDRFAHAIENVVVHLEAQQEIEHDSNSASGDLFLSSEESQGS